jgi:DNA-binding LacI/PurR family transcriptional regulator
MADVGRLARVSAQTVSRYFTGTGYVAGDTRERIEAAIQELGYRPNRVARNLRVSTTETIGVLAMDALNYGNAATISGLSAAAREADYSLIITHLDVDPDAPDNLAVVHRAIDSLISSQVDGIVLSTPYLGTERLLDHVWNAVPVVTISGRPWEATDSATVDSYRAGLVATGHLIELGHRRILHVAGPVHRNEAVERERGYRDAMAAAGLDPATITSTDWSARSGHRAAQNADPESYTAVFAANDQIALGFMRAMGERGLRSPDDFSIIGVDDMPDAEYFTPALSSMWMDFTELGRRAFGMVHERILTGERQERTLIQPMLSARESTRPL